MWTMVVYAPFWRYVNSVFAISRTDGSTSPHTRDFLLVLLLASSNGKVALSVGMWHSCQIRKLEHEVSSPV